jgi:hypothetical protein
MSNLTRMFRGNLVKRRSTQSMIRFRLRRHLSWRLLLLILDQGYWPNLVVGLLLTLLDFAISNENLKAHVFIC